MLYCASRITFPLKIYNVFRWATVVRSAALLPGAMYACMQADYKCK